MYSYFKKIISLVIFIFGFITFSILKRNNKFIYQAYVNTYCLTSGLISEFVSKIISFNSKVFLNFKKPPTKVIDISMKLKKNGYIILDDKLKENRLNGLIGLTKKLKCSYSKFDENSSDVIFDEKIHNLPTYYYDSLDLIKSKEVTDVIKYLDDLKISHSYFETQPNLFSVNMWWSTVGEKSDSFSAQDFHFDLDSIKWLKYFIYLNDVNIDNGPHVYIEGTNKVFSKPYSLLKQGYKRISDSEINKLFDPKRINYITGEKGTIIIGDTSCFHKGLVPKKSNRLIFEVTFSNSFFTDNNKAKILDNLYKKNLQYENY